MRLVVYSDLHLHCWKSGATIVDGRNSRLLDQQKVLEQIKQYCIQNEIEHLVCCGDVFHTQGKVDSEVLTVAWDSFLSIHDGGIKQYWLVGNHDQKDKAGRIHSMPFLEELGTVVDSWYIDENHGWVFLAHTHDKERLEWAFRNTGGFTFFIHQGVSQVPMINGYMIDEIFKPEMVPSCARHVFSGHYHSFNRVNDKITIPGSPMQLTWADRGQKRGWLDVTIPEAGPLEIKHIESDCPKFPEFDEGSKEEAKRTSPSVVDYSDLEGFFEQYAEAESISEEDRVIGRELIEGKYEVPEPKDQ